MKDDFMSVVMLVGKFMKLVRMELMVAQVLQVPMEQQVLEDPQDHLVVLGLLALVAPLALMEQPDLVVHPDPLVVLVVLDLVAHQELMAQLVVAVPLVLMVQLVLAVHQVPLVLMGQQAQVVQQVPQDHPVVLVLMDLAVSLFR